MREMIELTLGIIGFIGFLTLGLVILSASWSVAVELFTTKDLFLRVLCFLAFFPLAYIGGAAVVGSIMLVLNLNWGMI